MPKASSVVMWKPGAISGRVSDEAGEPLVDVFVRVLARQFVAGAVHLFAGKEQRDGQLGLIDPQFFAAPRNSTTRSRRERSHIAWAIIEAPSSLVCAQSKKTGPS